MKIASICRMLATRSHWVIHSVWLAVLAAVICVNVVFDYFQIQAADLRLLVSENSIAASVVKSEIASVTALLNAVEALVTEPEVAGPQESSTQDSRPIDKTHVAEHLYALARSNPLVGSLSLADSSGPIAASGSMDETSYGAVFSRTSEIEGHEPLTVSLGLTPAVTNRADLKLSVSDMTLPHGLCRVVLLEQIYRAFKINAREPYHK